MGWGSFGDMVGTLTGSTEKNQQASDLRHQANLNTANAMGQISPENIAKLMQAFMGHYMSLLAPSMMNAQSQLSNSFARSGFQNTGLAKQLSAGIPGQFSQQALSQALQSAMGIASKGADIQSGRPLIPTGGRNWMGDLADLALKYYSGGTMTTGEMGQGAGGGSGIWGWSKANKGTGTWV